MIDRGKEGHYDTLEGKGGKGGGILWRERGEYYNYIKGNSGRRECLAGKGMNITNFTL